MGMFMLTTITNPYNPFTQFDAWNSFDREKGYFTNSYLARIANTSLDMPESVYEEEVERAMDEICDVRFGFYKKVTPNDYKDGKWKALTDEEALSLFNFEPDERKK